MTEETRCRWCGEEIRPDSHPRGPVPSPTGYVHTDTDDRYCEAMYAEPGERGPSVADMTVQAAAERAAAAEAMAKSEERMFDLLERVTDALERIAWVAEHTGGKR
jgi:hypothetical protein